MTKIAWWVPRWSYVPHLRRGLRSELLSISFRRIGVASVVGMGFIYACFKLTYPDLGLAWLWNAPLAVVGVFGLMCCNLVVMGILVPPHVTVTPEKIHGVHGETAWIARREECSNFVLVTFSEDRHRLRFRHKGKRHSIGIGRSVDLYQLRSLLAPWLKTIDARRRYARFQSRTPGRK